MAVSQSIIGKQGVKNRFKDLSLDNAYQLGTLARKGLKPKVFYDFADEVKMPEKDLAALLHLSARTISNYKAQKKTLEPNYSEHLLKLIALYAKGEILFGNIDEFNYWLNKPFWNEKEKPVDWLITPGGADLLMAELDNLAEGYPV
jgi:putative toxin-antitoxin system antitoxin component (TIGR02293 family)